MERLEKKGNKSVWASMGYARLIWAAAAIARFYLGQGWGRGNSLRVRGPALDASFIYQSQDLPE